MKKFIVFCAVTWLGLGSSSALPSEGVELLAKSKILMDKTASAPPLMEKKHNDNITPTVTPGNQAKSLDGIASGSISVAQCRASCFTKLAMPTTTTTVSPNKGEEATTIIMDALSREYQTDMDYHSLMPKILRSRRSITEDTRQFNTVEIADCWKSCQDEKSVSNPVNLESVRTAPQEKVVQVSEKKLTWPKHSNEIGPVVYIVIQEYADRKWREIAQTTQLELPIPVDLSPAAKQKLNAVRVLVVTPAGLQRIYGVKPTPATRKPLRKTVPFVVRLGSLIHLSSLVVAEITWTGARSRIGQEYQVTWELAGGGLKGHLVTESTSVTLSLWPKTTYQISVSPIQVNLDSDGEQPASSYSVQSRPLIVNTSYASYPPGQQPSALLDSETDAEEDEPENESLEESLDEEGEFSDYKSIMKIMGVSFLSVVTVLLVWSWAEFLRIKLRECCSRRYFNGYERHQDLLQYQEGCDSSSPSIAVISKAISFPDGNVPFTSSYSDAFKAHCNCKSLAENLSGDCSQHV